MRPLLWTLVLTVVAGGCAGEDAAPYAAVADVPELMVQVMEPAAEAYWDAVGWILDESGTQEIRPRSHEEWGVVLAAAYQLAESGNLLLVPRRTADGREPHGEPAWRAMAQAMTAAGERAIAAARAEDPQAVFDTGAEVYFACANCHAVFAAELVRPSDEAAEGPG